MMKWITNALREDSKQYTDKGLIISVPRPTIVCSQQMLEEHGIVGVYDPHALQDPNEHWILHTTPEDTVAQYNLECENRRLYGDNFKTDHSDNFIVGKWKKKKEKPYRRRWVGDRYITEEIQDGHQL